MSRPPLISLGPLSPEEFLSNYWQKRPLLIRQAIHGFQSPISPDELAGLACEPEVESRLILSQGGETPWQALHGPFRERRFRSLPPTHWTLLVQEVNRHVPEVADLLDRFRFLPDWRVDDLMISFAAPEGGVGPHIDSYDVFLLQGPGRRRWQIGAKLDDPEHIPGVDVRVLARFEPTEEWVLEPGDVLYLPPGVPHNGIALEPCMTFSVGFLAPGRIELMKAWLEELAEGEGPIRRYEDPDLTLASEPGEITREALARVAGLMAPLTPPADQLGRWFGRWITCPRRGRGPEPVEPAWTQEEFTREWQQRRSLRRDGSVRLAFLEEGETTLLFVAGRCQELTRRQAPLARLLTDLRRLDIELMAGPLSDSQSLALLTELTNRGCFYFEAEEGEEPDEG